MDRRNDICATWRSLAVHQERVHYTMDQRRDDWFGYLQAIELAIKTGDWSRVTIWTDCSGSFELGYRANDCPDPSNLAYRYLGYTGTLLASGRHIAQSQALPADAMVCGPGTGTHVVGLLEPGTANGGNPLVFSHGHEQGISPEIRRLNLDNRTPRTFLRFDTNDHKATPPLKPLPPVVVMPAPGVAHNYAHAHGMVVITAAAAKLAIHNGISWYVWHADHMVGSRLRIIPTNQVLFAYADALDAAKIPHAGA